MKTFNEIMTDVQNAETMSEVLEIATYMQNNKYKYSLVQLEFAEEYIKEKYKEIKDNEFEIIKWVADLLDLDNRL